MVWRLMMQQLSKSLLLVEKWNFSLGVCLCVLKLISRSTFIIAFLGCLKNFLFSIQFPVSLPIHTTRNLVVYNLTRKYWCNFVSRLLFSHSFFFFFFILPLVWTTTAKKKMSLVLFSFPFFFLSFNKDVNKTITNQIQTQAHQNRVSLIVFFLS